MHTASEVNEWLAHSPYSMPEAEQSAEAVASLLERTTDLESRCIAVRNNLAQQLVDLRLPTRVNEIYESNAIEGKTATLADTKSIFESKGLWAADAAIARYTLQQSLADEPKVQDVVGLAAARILVDQYLEEPRRELTEADLRDMYGLILGDTPAAGRYKRYVNSIEGSSHVPKAPSDVPAAMSDLVRWIRESAAPPFWKSVAAHAWLTHIHPFEDGNGRMARLLANYLLGFGSYPPLIVKASTDRGRYIDALAESDEAGDIVQLARVFGRVLNRQAVLMESPDFAQRLFQADLRIRSTPIYDRWTASISRFVEDVAAQLRLLGSSVDRVGSTSPSDFELLRRRDRTGNGWLAKVKRWGLDADLLMWVGHTSDGVDRLLHPDQRFPSMFLSERDTRPRAPRPYLPSVSGRSPLYDEICVVADENFALLRQGDEVRRVKLSVASELWANILSNHLNIIEEPEARGRALRQE